MRTVLRVIAAVVAGMFLAIVLLVAVELFSAVVHPTPEGFTGTQEEMCQHVERYPAWVLAVAVGMWGAVALASTWVAQKIGNLVSASIVGLLLFVGLVFNLSMLPYPIWFKIASLLVIPAAIAVGMRWARRKSAV